MGAEAYRKRKRMIYALFFSHPDGCYIGQSVDPKRRARQHALPSGQWNKPFTMAVLTSGEWTKEEAELMERAYRLKAVRKGWRVYGLPHVFINPQKRATLQERWTSLFLPWPKKWVRRIPLWPWVVLLTTLLMGYWVFR